MNRTNKEAAKHLSDCGWIRSDEVVSDLIKGGFLEPDPISMPEQIADAARAWVGRNVSNTFNFAVGWSTASWKLVLSDSDISVISLEHDIPMLRNIFFALVILAKEAGVEL